MKTSTASRLFTAILILIAGLLVAGCASRQSKSDADKLVDRHFRAVSTNGFERAVADYGDTFFHNTTRAKWAATLEKLSVELGAYKSHLITGSHVFENTGKRAAGTTVLLQCATRYAKYSAEETFTLFKGATDSDYKIIGHQISSVGLANP